MSEPMYSGDPMKIQFPVAKTFIQYPALRNPSLEAFFHERGTSSCPASRMPSIDEENDAPRSVSEPIKVETPIDNSDDFSSVLKEINYTVKNTFIDNPSWEALRNVSLEGFFEEREIKSCPASRMQSLDDTPEEIANRFLATDPVQEKSQEVEHPALRSSSIESVCHQALRSISLEECLRDIEAKYQDLDLYDEMSTKANTEEDTAPPTPDILSESEEESLPRATISLTNSLGLWSLGSAEHSLGTCKPCAFLWKDANGCSNGTNCNFCHMCPPGEVKRRKKEKLASRKMVRQFHRGQAYQAFNEGAGYYGMC